MTHYIKSGIIETPLIYAGEEQKADQDKVNKHAPLLDRGLEEVVQCWKQIKSEEILR